MQIDMYSNKTLGIHFKSIKIATQVILFAWKFGIVEINTNFIKNELWKSSSYHVFRDEFC